MSEMVNVALDAMGGDNAPFEVIKGCVDALKEAEDIHVYAVGKEEVIREELVKYSYDTNRITVVDARETIEMADHPTEAIRNKKDSSLVKALYLVKEGTCEAFVSAGSSGAILVGGQAIVGKIKGVKRAPMAPLIPTAKGVSLLIDCGASADAKPEHLVQFAKMGSIYMKSAIGIENPRVALVNIGTEETKGNQLCLETYPLLKDCKDINFVGNIESRQIPNGDADVVVCDAFTGNVILKLYEGLSKTLTNEIKKGMMSTLKSKIGALLVKPALKKTLSKFSTEAHGGAPLLGLNGLVIKTHGSSKSIEIKNSILQCKTYKDQHISDQIKNHMSEA